MIKKIHLALGLAASLAFATPTIFAQSSSQQNFVTIGTGGQTGVYYPVGGAICRFVNSAKLEEGDAKIRCNIESTGGSVYNINAVRSGDLQFGIAQSDATAEALRGEKAFSGKPFDDLRVVFGLHTEVFNVLARANANVQNFQDIKGKRVNIGEPASGSRELVEDLMGRYGIKKSDLALASELRTSEQAQAICDNSIDVMIYTLGHPSGALQEATSTCDVNFVNVSGPEVDELIQSQSYLTKAVILGGQYKGTKEDVVSIGTPSVVMTSAAVSEEVVYAFTKAVFENFSRITRLHPALSQLTPEASFEVAQQSGPLHPGAERYFREIGFLKD